MFVAKEQETFKVHYQLSQIRLYALCWDLKLTNKDWYAGAAEALWLWPWPSRTKQASEVIFWQKKN